MHKLHVKSGLTQSRLWFTNQSCAYEYLYRNVKILSYKDIKERNNDGLFLFKLLELIQKRIQNINWSNQKNTKTWKIRECYLRREKVSKI